MSCLICRKLLDGDNKVVTVGVKGFKTLCKFSELRGDNLFSFSENEPENLHLHAHCRKKYTKENSSGRYKPLLFSSMDHTAPEECTESKDFPMLSNLSPMQFSHLDHMVPEESTESKDFMLNNQRPMQFSNLDPTAPAESIESKDFTMLNNLRPMQFSNMDPIAPAESIESKDFTMLNKLRPMQFYKMDYTAPEDSIASKRNDTPMLDNVSFPFMDRCFFCTGELGKANRNSKNRKDFTVQITKDWTKGTIIKRLQEAPSPRNQEILRRISDIDLVAAQARYHKRCYLRIANKNQTYKRGRPECIDVKLAMQVIYNFIDNNEDSQFTLTELRNLLSDYVPDDRTILKKLSKNYEQRFVSEALGTCPMIKMNCNGMNSTDKKTIDVEYNQISTDEYTERLRILEKAAEIIREDISLEANQRANYLPLLNFLKNVDEIPESFRNFLKTLAGQES